jgi:hypothetical protein
VAGESHETHPFAASVGVGPPNSSAREAATGSRPGAWAGLAPGGTPGLTAEVLSRTAGTEARGRGVRGYWAALTMSRARGMNSDRTVPTLSSSAEGNEVMTITSRCAEAMKMKLPPCPHAVYAPSSGTSHQ